MARRIWSTAQTATDADETTAAVHRVLAAFGRTSLGWRRGQIRGWATSAASTCSP